MGQVAMTSWSTSAWTQQLGVVASDLAKVVELLQDSPLECGVVAEVNAALTVVLAGDVRATSSATAVNDALEILVSRSTRELLEINKTKIGKHILSLANVVAQRSAKDAIADDR